MNWIRNKCAEIAGAGLLKTANGLGTLLVSFECVYIIIALIGVYFIVFGEKTLGTKITSISVLLYLLGRVLQSC